MISAAMMTKHLLNSLPRGNLVDGVPRAASSCLVYMYVRVYMTVE